MTSLIGDFRASSTLTANISIFAQDRSVNITPIYLWYLCDNVSCAIASSTSSQLVLDAADIGKQISLQVHFTDDAGNAEMSEIFTDPRFVESSNHSASFTLSSFSGDFQVGSAVTANISIFDQDGTNNSSPIYSWYVGEDQQYLLSAVTRINMFRIQPILEKYFRYEQVLQMMG